MELGNQIPKVKLEITNLNHSLCKNYKKNIFSRNTSALFINAITKISLENAKKYVSRNFIDIIDLDEIKDYLLRYENFTVSNKIYLKPKPENFRMESIFVKENDNIENSIIDLYLVFEPDNYSDWKICDIEKETSKRKYILMKSNIKY